MTQFDFQNLNGSRVKTSFKEDSDSIKRIINDKL